MRDDFRKKTIEILGKRVGYLCSNPTCRRPTIGASIENTKLVSIGIAAHITAASYRGSRYDENLSAEERSSIDNGIWLCSNCATLIDRDPEKFTVDILKEWKIEAEKESMLKLSGEIAHQKNGIPKLDIDLIWNGGGRFNLGYSNKNPLQVIDGRPTLVMGIGAEPPIIHWKVLWNFYFFIYNNSTYPAFNVAVKSIGTVHFTEIDRLPRINNIPPLQNINMKATYETFVEGTYLDADKMQKQKIPEKFNDLKLELTFNDNEQKMHKNIIEFKNGEVMMVKW